MVCDAARMDFLRPGDDERCPDTALVKISLVAAERSVAVEEVRVVSAYHVHTIVGGDD